jgi:c-di-GMP-binding flagellar brake protein YcgR
VAGKQRRHFFRVATDLQGRCRLVTGFLAGPSVGVRFLDLSAGGAWLEVPEPLPVGQGLKVELEVDDPPLSLRSRASVVRAQERDGRCYAGIAFRDLDKRGKAHVTRFVFAEARRSGVGAAYVEVGAA